MLKGNIDLMDCPEIKHCYNGTDTIELYTIFLSVAHFWFLLVFFFLQVALFCFVDDDSEARNSLSIWTTDRSLGR